MEIPAELCVTGRDLTEPRLAPDGRHVAIVVRWGGASAVVLVPVDGGPERLLTVDPSPAPGRGFGGGCFAWTPDSAAIVYAGADGDLWLQPVPGGRARRLTEHGDALVQAPSVSPDGAWVAYVVDQAEVWRAWLDGSSPGQRLDDGGADFCFDPHVSIEEGAMAVRWQAWSVPHMPWDASRVEVVVLDGQSVVERRRRVGAGSIQQPRTMPDGGSIEVRDDEGWANVWLGDAPLVREQFEHAGPSWGMGQRTFAVAPDGTRVAFTRNESGFGRLCTVRVGGAGGEEADLVRDVARGVHGQLDWRGDRLVALRSGARTPTQVVVYDTSGPDWTRRTLAVGPVAGWDAFELPEPEVVAVGHGDDVVHARRYVAGSGRTICWVHGGPTDQWQVEFMPRVAYWWSRGWDVLVPDPRGSTGYGRTYQRALNGEWGRLDVDDTAAVIRHAHANGWSTPATTVVMGGSSGGLTALGVMGRHRGLVAGGAVMYPVCDLADLTRRSHRFEAHSTLSLVGPLDAVDVYRERSPLSYADRIDVPVLVMHGDADPVVPVDQSIALAERIRSAGGDVELHVFDGEGHGFRRPENKLAEYRMVGDFLDKVVPPG